jgi:hypothetical protein
VGSKNSPPRKNSQEHQYRLEPARFLITSRRPAVSTNTAAGRCYFFRRLSVHAAENGD